MATLAIDTSSPRTSVALRLDGVDTIVREIDSLESHAEQLERVIREVTTEGGVTLAALRELRIGLGPGSFTGLRIGMSVAKGISIARKIPLMGIGSMHGAAAAPPQNDAVIVTVADARRNELFCALHRWSDNECVEIAPPLILSVTRLSEYLSQQIGTTPTRFLDCGLGELRTLISEVVPATNIALGLLSISRNPEPYSLEAVSLLEPHYTRAVSALTLEQQAERKRWREHAQSE